MTSADSDSNIHISDSGSLTTTSDEGTQQNGVAGEDGPTTNARSVEDGEGASTNGPDKDNHIPPSDEGFVLVGNNAHVADVRVVDLSTISSRILSTDNEAPDVVDANKGAANEAPKPIPNTKAPDQPSSNITKRRESATPSGNEGDIEAGKGKCAGPRTPCSTSIHATETGADGEKDKIETSTDDDVEDDATTVDDTESETPKKFPLSSPKMPQKVIVAASTCDADGAAAAKHKSVNPSLRHHSPAYLNAALESLESMRCLNLEVEFSEAAPSFPLCHEKCTHCQRGALREYLASPLPASQGREGRGDREGGINIGKLKLDGSRMRSLQKSLTEPRQQQAKDGGEQNHGINIGTLKLDGSRMRNLHKSLTELHQQDVQNLRKALTDFQGQGPISGAADRGEQYLGINIENAKLNGSRFRELFAKPGHNPSRNKATQDIASPIPPTTEKSSDGAGGGGESSNVAEAITRPTPPNVTRGEHRGINIGNVKLDGSRIRGLFAKPGQNPSHNEATQGTTSPKPKITDDQSLSGGISAKPSAAAGACDESSNEATEAATMPTLLDAAGGEEQQRGINIGNVRLDGSRIRGLFAKPGHNHSRKKSTEETTMPNPLAAGNKSLFRVTSAKPCAVAGGGNEGSSEETGATITQISPSKKGMSNASDETSTSSNSGCAQGSWVASSQRSILKKKPSPCLTCGHPTCSKHSSSTFAKNHIHICQSCARLFELDFLVEVIASTASNQEDCRKKVDEIVGCYDRAKFLLVCTAQYADEIAAALETHAARSNKIGAGSSATGIVSGITGAVGCGALLFPPVAVVGVPLLITSLVFGGGATAVQSGDAAAKYFSQPNRLAEKMVALHGMALSLLRITEVLSHGLLKSHLGVNYSFRGFSEAGVDEGKSEAMRQRETLAKDIHELLEKHGVSTTQAAVGGLQSAFTSGIVATEVGASSAFTSGIVATEVGASSVARGASMVGRSSRYFGRVGTTASAGARFIPIAGGLLSAACVYVEGKELKRTLERIREGNPCAKAEQVRRIRDELDVLPDSSLIAAECHKVFELAQKEKMKKEESEENDSVAQQGLEKVGGVTLEDVSQGDIGNLIDIMDAAARAEGIEGSAPGDGE